MDLTGERYGRLTVVDEAEVLVYKNHGAFRRWICLCDCGKTTIVRQDLIRNKNGTRSCGCIRAEVTAQKNKDNATHGLTGHPMLSIWYAMKERCTNPDNKSYHRYGGRGISICPEWLEGPELFIEWAEREANWNKNDYSLDRVDNNKGYSPDNCRFVDLGVQARNKRLPINNTTRYRGVTKRSNGTYRSSITVDKARHALGHYKTVELAAEARQLKELELFGHLLPETRIATEKVRQEINRINRESLS